MDLHLAGCDWCERFGGRYAGMVQCVREKLAAPTPLPVEVSDRLMARLRAAQASDG